MPKVWHLSKCQPFSAPHFLFLWRVKEKENAPLAVETTEAPPVADKARLFRGSGTIGGHEGLGNRFAATVFKEKEIVWQLVGSLVKKQTAVLTLLHSACRFVLLLFPLPLVQSFSIITMGAAAKREAGQFVTQHHPRKQNIWLEGLAADTHPRRFLFLLYRQRHVFFFFARERKRRCGVEICWHLRKCHTFGIKENGGAEKGMHSRECKSLPKGKQVLKLSPSVYPYFYTVSLLPDAALRYPPRLRGPRWFSPHAKCGHGFLR